MSAVDTLDAREYIIIKGARVHNLKNVDLAIPRGKFVVITGLSGSGKSSLAFDTLYAEGQRRYVESLSSYARQFMGRLNKPDVDYIKGISPAIAIEQKVNTRNPRSTVGTSTEIYDFLKLLFARAGKTYSPISDLEVKKNSVSDIVDFILKQPDQKKCILFTTITGTEKRTLKECLGVLSQQGFARIMFKDEIIRIDEAPTKIKETDKKNVYLIIDRFAISHDDEFMNRVSDSVQTALYEGNNECYLRAYSDDKTFEDRFFSSRFELDGISFEEPTVNLFAFNNPFGACKTCEGYGSVIGIDENLVVPNKNLSVYDGAIACWRGPTMKEYQEEFILKAYKHDFPVHRPYNELNKKEKVLLWEGTKGLSGLNSFFKFLESQTYKIQYRVMLSRYRGRTVCLDCRGTRLRKDASYVKINNASITDLVLMQVKDLKIFFDTLLEQLDANQQEISKRLILEIKNRIKYLCDVGLGYLTLNRLSNTLSGGESQRINLATSLGSNLVGSLYILDEPSIGLHPRDTQRLISVIKSLKALGNTVVVVEHDEEIMRAADEIIDIGPYAGSHGGNLIFQGSNQDLKKESKSITAAYLNGSEKIEVPAQRRKWSRSITIEGAQENNLKNINVTFPLQTFTVVTGVSGSGKSTLVKRILYSALQRHMGESTEVVSSYEKLSGDIDFIKQVEFVDQNPIGKSTRSNPVTYIKAYDEIRTLFSNIALAKNRAYKPAHFSFNVTGGRCEVCEGEGMVTIPMQFMADIHLVCETCNGRRFKQEILEVTIQNKNIFDILELTVDDAIEFFDTIEEQRNVVNKLISKLKALSDVGLGYVKLGQASSTLSGGEAQRIKLAYFLTIGNTDDRTLFIFDEPTTGLHFHDIKKLLKSFDALLKLDHSIIVIEHNPDVIKCADWIIDIGHEGGDEGGKLLFAGTPEDLINSKESYTALYIKDKL